MTRISERLRRRFSVRALRFAMPGVVGVALATAAHGRPLDSTPAVEAAAASGASRAPAPAAGGASVCPSYLQLIQGPPARYRDSLATVVFEFGENRAPEGEMFCVMGGSPDPATFRVRLNGRDTTAAFTIAWWSDSSMRATGVVRFDNAVVNVLAASDTGYDAFGSLREDTVSLQSTVTYGLPAYPIVDVRSQHTDSLLERDLCVTVALGAAASECGDLRLAHPLPSVRTYNKTRTPVLLYNSQHAHPHPVVGALVTLAADAGLPDSVTAVLQLGGANRATGRWTGEEWVLASARTRRIALGFDALDLATGVYTISLQTIFWYGTQARAAQPVQSQIIIVNRAASRFGAGWWVAGVEELRFLSGGKVLWVGGDGSTRIFMPDGSGSAWTTQNVSYPERLTLGANGYTRYLPDRVRVEFDLTGRHTATADRHGRLTTLEYYTGTASLQRITVPPSAAALSYEFVYTAGTGVLERIEAPALTGQPRHLLLSGVSGLPLGGGISGWQITRMQGPDTTSVRFRYADTSGSLGDYRIAGRTDRRGNVSFYRYDGGFKVSRASLPLAGTDSAVTTLAAAESRGLAVNGAGSVDTNLASAFLDGPRTDVGDTTRYWTNRLGAVTRVRNALGHVSSVEYGDSRWLGLVTSSRAPNGFTVVAAYDTRGNLLRSVAREPYGPGSDSAMARYIWHPTLDVVTRITSPTGVITDFEYDTTTGNRLWQQDGRGAPARVVFRYDASGLLTGVKLPLSPWDSVGYDARGNVSYVRTPRGYPTWFHKDGLGRDTLVRSPLNEALTAWRHDSTSFDLHDQPLRAVTFGHAFAGTAEQRLIVTSSYDADGNPTAVQRSSSPDPASIGTITTSWRYDRGGRKVAEIAPDGRVDSTAYDAGGNVRAVRTRRGFVAGFEIVSEYDALNRLSRRITPSVTYADTTHPGWSWYSQYYDVGSTEPGWTFPRYPNCQSTKLCIPADTAVFTHDATGNLLTADNRDARIRRSYFANGALQTDSIRIRTLEELSAGGNFSTHVYGMRMGYDADGRRRFVKLPGNLAARFTASPSVARDSVAYAYDSLSGMVSRVRDVMGNQFAYLHDDNSRLAQIDYPRGHFKRLYFNADGQPDSIRQDRTATGSTATVARLTYDWQGRVVRAIPLPFAEIRYTYSALGALSSESRWKPAGNRRDENTHARDALGNGRSVDLGWSAYEMGMTSSGSSSTTSTFEFGTGRLLSSFAWRSGMSMGQQGCTTWNRGVESAEYRYDGDGNAQFVTSAQTDSGIRYSSCQGRTINDLLSRELGRSALASYYGADGKLRVSDVRTWGYQRNYARAVYEEHRYDALGRRVLRRQRDCYLVPDCAPIIRFVWDGSAIAAEVASTNDSLRVLYAHGGDLDRPLTAMLVGYNAEPVAVAPDWDWRGIGYGHTCYGNPPNIDINWCVAIEWPERNAFLNDRWFDLRGQPPTATQSMGGFFGTLLSDQVDGSGQFYRRNRFYDPATGRFTQEDPIGLAGGINLYGFANGDPVTYSDPFGLCPNKDDPACSIGQQIRANIEGGVRNAIAAIGDFGNSLREGLKTLAREAAIQGGLALMTGGQGNAIRITGRGLAHVAERHTAAGALSAGKSVFNAGENLTGLVRNSESIAGVRQSFGRNFERVVDAGREIGIDRATGKPTSVYTVITNIRNDLVTMFPGMP